MLPINEIICDWENCYDDSWQRIIVPEAFSHPAKMSYGLLKRILAHAKKQSWLNKGDVIVDPFGGIASTGILGAYEGYQVICCELEQKFVDLAEQNFKLHDNAWRKLGCPRPVIIQGDSRRLCEVVEKADIILSSPPYMGQDTNIFATANQGKRTCDLNPEEKAERKAGAMGSSGFRNLSNATPGQLGSMKPGSIDAVVSSPPFMDTNVNIGAVGDTPGMRQQIHDSKPRKDSYGQTPGQLSAMKLGNVDMVVSSPPYAETLKGDGTQKETAKESRDKRRTPGGSLGQSQRTQGYGSRGNLGNLKPGQVDCTISSPPYEKSIQTNGDGIDWSKIKEGGTNKTLARAAVGTGYGKTKGQLAEEQGDTFWSAAKIIVQQCHQILKLGGVAIWVVKAFVRKGAIVDFPGDWKRLCESVGFVTLCEHHAMLIKETKEQSLFGDTIKTKKERKSFFRRLAELKGSPPIDFENVICMRKANKHYSQ